jgi:hypothetical protein
VKTAALNARLRPPSAAQSWRRVAGASGLVLAFAVVSLITFVTDMPGYYYASGVFALTNVIVVPIVGSLLVLHPAPATKAPTFDELWPNVRCT